MSQVKQTEQSLIFFGRERVRLVKCCFSIELCQHPHLLPLTDVLRGLSYFMIDGVNDALNHVRLTITKSE